MQRADVSLPHGFLAPRFGKGFFLDVSPVRSDAGGGLERNTAWTIDRK